MSSVTKPSTAGASPDTAPPQPPPPSAQIFGMQIGALVPQMLHVLVARGIPDLLAERPCTAAELAATTGLHERSLHRLLRSLAGLGFLTESSPNHFALTPLGSVLTSADEGGGRDLVLLLDWWWKAMGEFPRTVETGTDGIRLAFDMPFFEYLEHNPVEGERFGRALQAAHAGEKEAVAATYDFSSVRTVVDVAGGTGTLLARVLQRHPTTSGVLFDLPAVIANSTAELDGLGDRFTTVAGDFFESVPAGADCYVLSHVIHDWDDDRCIDILRNCQRSMNPHGRVLLVEMVIPPGDDPHPAKMLDMLMLCVTGGMERSEEEYADLLDRAGFRLTRLIPTPSPVSIIEALPAPTP
jgi:hypothetical protein